MSLCSRSTNNWSHIVVSGVGRACLRRPRFARGAFARRSRQTSCSVTFVLGLLPPSERRCFYCTPSLSLAWYFSTESSYGSGHLSIRYLTVRPEPGDDHIQQLLLIMRFRSQHPPEHHARRSDHSMLLPNPTVRLTMRCSEPLRHVTPAASAAALPPPCSGRAAPPRSLSLGPLGVARLSRE